MSEYYKREHSLLVFSPRRQGIFAAVQCKYSFTDTGMLEHFKEIKAFKEEYKEKIYFTLNALIREVYNRKRYAHK